jgi:O-antigen/teichoic acid export membrane protein
VDVEVVSVREIATTAWPLFITTVFLFILSQAGLWILAKYRTPDEVAMYGAAARLVLLVVTPLIVVNAVVPPLIADMYVKRNHRQLESLLRTVSAIAGIPALLAVGILAVAGEAIMQLIYGSQYGVGATVLAVLALGSVVHIWAGSANIALMSTGHQTTMMVTTAVTGIVAVLLALYAVADYGTLGVAVGMAVGGSVQSLGLWWVTHRKIGIWTHMGRLRRQHLYSVLRVIRNRGVEG